MSTDAVPGVEPAEYTKNAFALYRLKEAAPPDVDCSDAVPAGASPSGVAAVAVMIVFTERHPNGDPVRAA
jgi:hypothetical protein